MVVREEEEEGEAVLTAKEAEEGTEGRGLIRLAGSMKAWLPPSTHAASSRPTKGTCRSRRTLLMVVVVLLLLRLVVAAVSVLLLLGLFSGGCTHAPGPALCVSALSFLSVRVVWDRMRMGARVSGWVEAMCGPW